MFNNLIIFVFINLYSLIFSQECADSGGNPVDCKLRCQFDDVSLVFALNLYLSSPYFPGWLILQQC